MYPLHVGDGSIQVIAGGLAVQLKSGLCSRTAFQGKGDAGFGRALLQDA
jgi:hypothetical protein